MKKQYRAYMSLLVMSLMVLSACGKKVAKTTSSSDEASNSRSNGGLSVPNSSFSSSSSSSDWSSSSSSSSVSSSSSSSVSSSSSTTSSSSSSSSFSSTSLRQCGTQLTGLADNGTASSQLEQMLAKFFFKTVVPDSERNWMWSDLYNKYWNGTRFTGIMKLQGYPTYCLFTEGSARRLRIEYEDAFGISSIEIASSKSYYVFENGSDINDIWMDSAGFIQLVGTSSGATLKFANMPTNTALNARLSSDRTAAPLLTYQYDRNNVRNSTSSVDTAVTSYTFPPNMFLDSTSWPGIYSCDSGGQCNYDSGTFSPTVKQRLRDMISRYVDSDSTTTGSQTINSNYNRYLIVNGKLGTGSVPSH